MGKQQCKKQHSQWQVGFLLIRPVLKDARNEQNQENRKGCGAGNKTSGKTELMQDRQAVNEGQPGSEDCQGWMV